MKANTNYEAIEKYIFDAMDFDGRDINPVTKLEKLQAIHSFFLRENWFDNNIKKFKGNEIAGFADWLQGAPSCLNIDIYYVDIIPLANWWGVNTDTEKKEDAFCQSWYNRISMSFYFLLNRETKLSKKPAKANKAFKGVKFSFVPTK